MNKLKYTFIFVSIFVLAVIIISNITIRFSEPYEFAIKYIEQQNNSHYKKNGTITSVYLYSYSTNYNDVIGIAKFDLGFCYEKNKSKHANISLSKLNSEWKVDTIIYNPKFSN